MTRGQAVAFYNEMDPFAVEWLRNLIAAGEIPYGVVDQRSIADVAADELAGFTQCHFFAGIGIWPLALRSARWPDDRPIWTGSCPCQPFSAAGKQQKFDDERHLWPVWFRLIAERRPPVVLGEQVASALDWLDLVSNDMEGAGYAFGASDLCAPGFGVAGWSESAQGEWLRRAIRHCPDPVVAGQLLHFAEWADANLGGRNGEHIRQRLYFVGLADADGGVRCAGQCAQSRVPEGANTTAPSRMPGATADGGAACGLGHTNGARTEAGIPEQAQWHEGCAEVDDHRGDRLSRPGAGRSGAECVGDGEPRGMADAEHDDRRAVEQGRGPEGRSPDGRHLPGAGDDRAAHAPDLAGHAVDWLYCRDGKWRPVEGGTFPLADADTARVGRLRAYGNALDAQTATAFCRVVREMVEGETA